MRHKPFKARRPADWVVGQARRDDHGNDQPHYSPNRAVNQASILQAAAALALPAGELAAAFARDLERAQDDVEREQIHNSLIWLAQWGQATNPQLFDLAAPVGAGREGARQ